MSGGRRNAASPAVPCGSLSNQGEGQPTTRMTIGDGAIGLLWKNTKNGGGEHGQTMGGC